MSVIDNLSNNSFSLYLFIVFNNVLLLYDIPPYATLNSPLSLYLKRLEKLDADFEDFLSDIDIKQLAVLLTPPEKPKVEKNKPSEQEEEVVEEVE